MFKKLPNDPTGPTAARVGVTTSMSFDQMAAEQAAKQAAASAERRAAGDPSQYQYQDPQTVMNTALMTGTGNKTGPSAKPLHGAMVPSGTDFRASDINGPTFSDYFGMNDPPRYSTAVPSSSTAVPMLDPPPKGASRVRQPQSDLMKFGGRRLLCKSKKGGKRVVKSKSKSKSKSAKRCRRNRVKAMRSRRAHRRYMMTV